MMAEITRKELIMILNGTERPRLAGVDLSMENCRRLDFENSNMRGAVLQAANFDEAIVRNCNMTGINMTKTRAMYADFANSNLTAGNLTLANLEGARLTDTNLTNVNLNGANLRGANMKGAKVEGLKFDSATTWPDGKKGTAGNPNQYI